jgi:hypothetical protein
MATPSVALTDHSENAVSRYLAGYRVVRTLGEFSQICKAVGLLAGIMVVLFGVMGSETLMRPNPSMVAVASEQAQHNIYLISVIFFGALIAFAGWLIGALIGGYGKHLEATLDLAVSGSPFLSNLQRARVMRIE